MVQDYTKIGIQPKQLEASDPLTEAVRDGAMGIDDPTKGLRKGISAAWELLDVLKYGLAAAVCLLFGCAFTYTGLARGLAPQLLALGIGSLALSALFARWTLHAARILRSVLRA